MTKPSNETKRLIKGALSDSLKKLSPRSQIKNPVIFTVYVGSVLTTAFFLGSFFGRAEAPRSFILFVSLSLWFTVFFANFAEALAEGRGKAHADALRKSQKTVIAKRLIGVSPKTGWDDVPSYELKPGNFVYVAAGDVIPADGEVYQGIASVDESAITGESAPVIRESGGDRSAVTGGTRVTSDWLVVKVTAEPGKSFLDRMIAMVEGADRRKTPNEIALTILLVAITIVFLAVTASLFPFTSFLSGGRVSAAAGGAALPVTSLVALFVCLAPTTIGGLLSAIGIAGMNRLSGSNVLALSGRSVETAGDVDLLLLDKTGTITFGNRRASEFVPAPGVPDLELADAAQLSSIADETPEGRSIVIYAKGRYNLRGRSLEQTKAEFIPFSAGTRMSGINVDGRHIRKGAVDAVAAYVKRRGGTMPAEVRDAADRISKSGGTPLAVADGPRTLGLVHLKDILKGGIRERFTDLRKAGIRTVMITGDNPLTAVAIAAEAGVDDVIAEATPEKKLTLIREYQRQGHVVAMTGDGTNDAPALAQANVAVAMNTGTQAAKEAGNMVDLDSDPSKLIDIVRIGKQLLMTRGSLTTFSIANDVAKYFAIIPALFSAGFPALAALNVLRLGTPESAILSSVIFNALIIVLLIPLALKGVAYRSMPASRHLRRNILIYGLGGLVSPFAGIKLIDILLTGRFL